MHSRMQKDLIFSRRLDAGLGQKNIRSFCGPLCIRRIAPGLRPCQIEKSCEPIAPSTPSGVDSPPRGGRPASMQDGQLERCPRQYHRMPLAPLRRGRACGQNTGIIRYSDSVRRAPTLRAGCQSGRSPVRGAVTRYASGPATHYGLAASSP